MGVQFTQLSPSEQSIYQVVRAVRQVIQYLTGANFRSVLTKATTFYVATNGSDSNSGLSSSAPWLTLAHAMSTLSGQYDFGGQAVTLQAASGHAAFTSQLHITPWVGGGSFTFDGGAGSIAITGTSAAILDEHVGTATVQNVLMSSTGAQALDINCSGTLFLGSNSASGLTFGTCGGAHMRLRNPGGTLFAFAGGTTYNTTGGADSHVQVTSGQAVFEGVQVTHTNSITFGTAFLNMFGGFIFAGGNWNVTAQTVHGPRYLIRLPGAAIETHANPNFFPGDAAGTAWAPGAYA